MKKLFERLRKDEENVQAGFNLANKLRELGLGLEGKTTLERAVSDSLDLLSKETLKAIAREQIIQAERGLEQLGTTPEELGHQLMGEAQASEPQAAEPEFIDVAALQNTVVSLQVQVHALDATVHSLSFSGAKLEATTVHRGRPNAERPEPVKAEGYEFNKPEDLPPVGCNLLIVVPAFTKAYLNGTDETPAYIFDQETVIQAFRTKHLSNRNGEMEYRLSDGCIVTGRLRWTYP